MKSTYLILTAIILLLLNTSQAYAAGVIATVKVGNSPTGVAVNTKTNEIAVSNSKSNTISVISGETNKVTNNINVASGPNMVYFMESPSEIYATCESGNVLSLIDAAINEVGAEIPISSPSGIALDEGSGQTYVISETGGTVSLFDFFTRSVADTVSVGQRPKQIAINPKTFYGYITNFDSDSVTIIDERGVAGSRTSSIMLGGGLEVGDGPSGVAVNLVTDKVYVTNVNSNTITEIDSSENMVTGTLSISKGKGIFDIAVDASRSKLYVTSRDTNELLILDPSGNVLETVKVGNKPSGVAVNQITGIVYVTNEGSDTVSVVDVEKTGTSTSTSGGGTTTSGGTVSGFTCVTSLSTDNAPPSQVFEEAINNLKSSLEGLNKISEVSNAFVKVVNFALSQIGKGLNESQDKCSLDVTVGSAYIDYLLSILIDGLCSKRPNNKRCIPDEEAEDFIDCFEESHELVKTALTFDGNKNCVPDLCEEENTLSKCETELTKLFDRALDTLTIEAQNLISAVPPEARDLVPKFINKAITKSLGFISDALNDKSVSCTRKIKVALAAIDFGIGQLDKHRCSTFKDKACVPDDIVLEFTERLSDAASSLRLILEVDKEGAKKVFDVCE